MAGCRRPFPDRFGNWIPGGAALTAHLSRGRAGRRCRSWHLPERVSFGGCPGVKGPFPQPVSMSGREVYGGPVSDVNRPHQACRTRPGLLMY